MKKTGSGAEIYSDPEAEELSKHYGIDVVYELSKILSEQHAKEIEIGILRGFGIEPDRNKRRKISINKILKSFE